MDGFFLDCFNFKSIHFLIKDLTHIHDNGFVDFLPQVSSEDLDEGDLERGDFTVHKDTGKIELDLETNVDVRSVDGW